MPASWSNPPDIVDAAVLLRLLIPVWSAPIATLLKTGWQDSSAFRYTLLCQQINVDLIQHSNMANPKPNRPNSHSLHNQKGSQPCILQETAALANK